MTAHDVDLVLVGVEELGIQEFLDGNYFADSEKIYIDQDLQTYKALGLSRCGYMKLPGQLLSKDFKDYVAKGNVKGIKGNMKGDGLQYGGTFVVDKQSNVLFQHKQQRFSDHPAFSDILDSLGISSDNKSNEKKPEMKCDENACHL